jgi:hypothetical protein
LSFLAARSAEGSWAVSAQHGAQKLGAKSITNFLLTFAYIVLKYVLRADRMKSILRASQKISAKRCVNGVFRRVVIGVTLAEIAETFTRL